MRSHLPVHRQLGVPQSLGYSDPPKEPRPQRRSGSSPVTEILPHYIVEPAGFHQITVPSGLTFATGNQAWYGLRRIRFEEDLPESQFVGYSGWMLPPDVNGVSGLAWGDRRGVTAAIVLGQNLPIQVGQWSQAQAHVPGIDLGGTIPAHAQVLGQAGAAPRYIGVESFPTGAWSDTTPNKQRLTRTFAPFVHVCGQGTTLDVALVMRAAYAASAGFIIGFVDLRLVISPIDGAGNRATA